MFLRRREEGLIQKIDTKEMKEACNLLQLLRDRRMVTHLLLLLEVVKIQ
ncbi:MULTISPECIES: hypothetical protein [Bacillus]|nr:MULTISPECIES: hypothetical protein [Bacillus]